MRRLACLVSLTLRVGIRSGAVVIGAVMVGAPVVGCFFTVPECVHCGQMPPDDAGNPACELDPTQDVSALVDDCGVFVSASAAAGGDGSKARPYQSFADAAAKKPKRVYACAETYSEMAGVTFNGGVEVYAGFTECSNAWTWSGTAKATLQGPADEVALTLSDGDNHVENLNVVAANAVADGGNSIAVVASGGTVAWMNGDITAGDAKDGVAGVTFEPMDFADSGDPGAKGSDLCSGGANNAGAMGTMKMCTTGGTSIGGDGGDGGTIDMNNMLLPAGNGTDGSPADPMFPTLGLGGVGEGQGMPAAPVCLPGQSGAPGANGTSGEGATGIGSISASGYAGVDGVAGTNGKPGQGGGGGGGSMGGLNINCGMGAQNRVGASGGAGGTGGCGGSGGGAGQAGGSSIALVVIDAAVTLQSVKLTAGKAGNGGAGGNGQNYGQGGTGGAAGAGTGLANPSCNGGAGGRGGVGGPGGGGQGGHALGIALQGTISPMGGEFVVDVVNAGLGGVGGQNNTTANMGKGIDGLAQGCWDFAANLSCGG